MDSRIGNRITSITDQLQQDANLVSAHHPDTGSKMITDDVLQLLDAVKELQGKSIDQSTFNRIDVSTQVGSIAIKQLNFTETEKQSNLPEQLRKSIAQIKDVLSSISIEEEIEESEEFDKASVEAEEQEVEEPIEKKPPQEAKQERLSKEMSEMVKTFKDLSTSYAFEEKLEPGDIKDLKKLMNEAFELSDEFKSLNQTERNGMARSIRQILFTLQPEESQEEKLHLMDDMHELQLRLEVNTSPVFHKNLSRERAEELLKAEEKPAYLIRSSSTQKPREGAELFVISFKGKSSKTHHALLEFVSQDTKPWHRTTENADSKTTSKYETLEDAIKDFSRREMKPIETER